MLHTVNDIGYNRACCRQLTCSCSIIHCIPQCIAMYQNTVKYIIYKIKRVLVIDHARCYHGKIFAVHFFAHGKQLDRIACFFCICKIICSNLCNTLCINILKIYIFTIDQRRKNGDLTTCIITFHICFRIALRIAFVLCFLQHCIKIRTFLFHLGQNVVCCTI